MGGKQLGFSDYGLKTAKKQTKREKFLSEKEVVVPWQALIDLIEPHYPKARLIRTGTWVRRRRDGSSPQFGSAHSKAKGPQAA